MRVRPQVLEVRCRAREVTCAGARLDGVRRLVVARTDKLGDLLLTLPALDAVRRTYPQARLELLTRPEWLDIAARFAGVDEVWAPPPTTGALAAALRARAPDAIVCIARRGSLAVAAARAGVRHRVGTGRRFYSALFTRTVTESRRHCVRHEVEHALAFAHRVGAAGAPARFSLRLREKETEGARSWLRGHGLDPGRFVCLHAGSGGSCPPWPARRFTELAAHFRGGNLPYVWTAGAGETAPDDGAPVHRGSLPSLAALLSAAAGIVASSTGPVHLAVALGRPAVSIHAPWSSCGVERWGPYGAGGVGIVAASAGAERWPHAERRARAGELMAGVAAADVFEVARRLLR